MSDNTIKSYLERVGEQIRWKRAKAPLLRELESHIFDRRESLIKKGIEPDEAERRAVCEMGDPEETGLELDRIHRPRPNWGLMGCAAALLLLGLLLAWAVGDRETYFGRMLVYAAIGAAAMAAGYFLDYTMLAKMPLAVFFGLCGVCMVLPMIGNRFLSTAAQLCYILPLLYAVMVYRFKGKTKKDTLMIALGYVFCMISAVFSHHWTTMVIYTAIVCGGILIYASHNGRLRSGVLLTTALTLGVPAVSYILICLSARISYLKRIEAVVSPQSDPNGMGWTTMRLREILQTSRFFGEGASGSETLESFLSPNQFVSVEYTLAAAMHKYGIIVALAVAALVIAAGVLMIKGIKRQSCGFGAIIALAAGLGFAVRTVGYFACNLGFNLIHFEGIPLFSYCGKLMIADMFVAGLVLSVFRNESIARDSRIAERQCLRQ